MGVELEQFNGLFTKKHGSTAYRTIRQARVKTRVTFKSRKNKSNRERQESKVKMRQNIMQEQGTDRHETHCTFDNLAREQWKWTGI